MLLLEAVAQLAGVVAQSDPNRAPRPGRKLTALRQVKILGTARPGEILQIRVAVNGRLGNLVQATGTVRLPDRLLLQADVTLAGQAAP